MKRSERLHWADINQEQRHIVRRIIDEQYGHNSLVSFRTSEKVLIYPGETNPKDNQIRTAHSNLLSTVLALETTNIAIHERIPTGSYVIGFNLNGEGVVTFSQAGVGDGRYLDKIQRAVVDINKDLLPLSGRRNLIPELS